MFRVGGPVAKDVQNNASLGCGAIVAVQTVLIEQWRDVPARRSARPCGDGAAGVPTSYAGTTSARACTVANIARVIAAGAAGQDAQVRLSSMKRRGTFIDRTIAIRVLEDGLGATRPSAGAICSAVRSILIGADDFSAGPGDQGGDQLDRGDVLDEVDGPINEQAIRPTGVERVDLVVARAVDHARAAADAVLPSLGAGQAGVGEVVGPGAAAAADGLDDPVDRQAVDLRTCRSAGSRCSRSALIRTPRPSSCSTSHR